MKIEDQELLSQYLDNELSTEQSIALKQRLLAEPELNAHLQKLKQVDRSVNSAFTMEDEGMPEAFAELLQLDPEEEKPPVSEVGTPAKYAGKQDTKPGTSKNGAQIWYLPVAASVAFVFIIATYLMPGGDNPNAAFDAALNSSVAMQPTQLADETKFVVFQSFLNRQGQPCREYMLQSSNAQTHGVACKQGSAWQVLLESESTVHSDGYLPASEEDSEITSYLAEQVQQVLTDSEEQERINNGW